jgi:hypothetical protein
MKSGRAKDELARAERARMAMHVQELDYECDRCHVKITMYRTTIVIKCSARPELGAAGGMVDLCDSCGADLAAWLREPPR